MWKAPQHHEWPGQQRNSGNRCVVAFADESSEEVRHEPLGTVLNISAWNYPIFVSCNVFLPALLCGNAVLYKPSEHAMLFGQKIGELLHAAGRLGHVLKLTR